MFKTRKLNCGVRIVMEDNSYVKSVAIGIFVKAGSVDEDPKYAGISHFIEHMMFKGTEKRSAKQIAADADKIAGNINAYTSKELTCYHIKTLTENTDKAIELLTDIFMNSKFDPAEMNRERNVIFEEMSMCEDTPDDLAYEIAMGNVFDGNPLGPSIIGNRTALKRVSRNVLTDYLHAEYTADSIVVAVAGNFDEETVCELFDKYLTGIKPSKKEKQVKDVKNPPKCSVRVKDIEQSHIMLATRSISLGDDLYYAMAILTTILGGTMSSRLFQNVREQKGLAYSVYAMNHGYSKMGTFMIYAGVSHSNIHKAISAIKHELDVLKKDGITKEEFEMSKVQLKGNYIYGLENVNSRMMSIGKNMLLLDKYYTPEEVISEIDSVSSADIQKSIDMIGDINTYSGALVSDHRAKLKEMLYE